MAIKSASARGMFFRALVLTLFAVGLTACGTYEGESFDPRQPGDQCVVGSAPVRAAACPQVCQDGFIAGLRCLPDGRTSACTCIPNGEFPSGSQDAGVAPTPTPPGMVTVGTACPANGRVRQALGGSCPAGQVLVATCVNLVWSSPSCTRADGGPNRWCVAGSVTDTPSCGVCPNGQSGRRECESDGMGYADCLACPSTPSTCQNAGASCTAACSGGTVPGTIVCQGSLATCVATPGAQCSGGGSCQNGVSENCAYQGCPGGVAAVGTRVCSGGQWGACVLTASGCPGPSTCSNGQTRSCAFSCSGGGTVAGTETCNSGTWSACAQNAGTTCGGGSGGDRVLTLRINPSFWTVGRTSSGASTGVTFCAQGDLNVRGFDGNGQQIVTPLTTNRVVTLRSFKAGAMAFDVVCGTAPGAPVHPALRDGTFMGQLLDSAHGIEAVGVTNAGTSALANQLGVARFCTVTGGVKALVAVDGVPGRCTF